MIKWTLFELYFICVSKNSPWKETKYLSWIRVKSLFPKCKYCWAWPCLELVIAVNWQVEGQYIGMWVCYKNVHELRHVAWVALICMSWLELRWIGLSFTIAIIIITTITIIIIITMAILTFEWTYWGSTLIQWELGSQCGGSTHRDSQICPSSTKSASLPEHHHLHLLLYCDHHLQSGILSSPTFLGLTKVPT